MKRSVLITILTTLILGSCGVSQEDYDKVKSELEKTKEELLNCSTELTKLKNTAKNRFIRAKKLLAENNFSEAKVELKGIVDNYKGTNDAIVASKEIAKIDRIIEQKRIEEERKKALGYKILKPTTIAKYGDLSLKFEKIWKGKRWTFDNYGSRYFFRDAQRGNSHILARVSITSKSNDPSLPPILVYQMNNGELKLLGTLRYEFRRWEDYGSYLGNYADYGNDFAHSKTIRFSCGVELSNEDLKSGNIYIILKKQGCFNRTKNEYGNPEIAYRKGNCNPKVNLKVDDFDGDYILLKKL